VFAALDGELLTHLALSALHLKHYLLGRLGLLVEDRLGLSTITLLLPIVTTLALSEERRLSGYNNGERAEATEDLLQGDEMPEAYAA